MRDFYFKMQLNISSSVYEVCALQIAELINDYFDNKLCLEANVEIRKMTKEEYLGL